MLSTNATELYIGRFIAGFVAGGTINLTLLFVSELADDKSVIKCCINFVAHEENLN